MELCSRLEQTVRCSSFHVGPPSESQEPSKEFHDAATRAQKVKDLSNPKRITFDVLATATPEQRGRATASWNPLRARASIPVPASISPCRLRHSTAPLFQPPLQRLAFRVVALPPAFATSSPFGVPARLATHPRQQYRRSLCLFSTIMT